MKLTEHFTLEEFERSATAARLHIDNRVPAELVPNLKRLCELVLEPLREHFQEAVYVTSGYRCPQLNNAVGGVHNSQHMRGEAVDICPLRASPSPDPSPVREGRGGCSTTGRGGCSTAAGRGGCSTAVRMVPDSHSPEARKKMREWAEWIMDNCPFDQLLRERRGQSCWIHVSLRATGENRQMVRKIGG